MSEELADFGRGCAPAATAERPSAGAADYVLEDLPPAAAAGPLLTPLWRWVRTGRVPASVLLATSAVCAGATCAGTLAWAAHHQRHVRDARVSVLAQVPYYGVSQVGGTRHEVALEGVLEVVNAGPAPVQVLDVHGVRSGLTITPMDGPVNVKAGHALRVNVHVSIACMAYVLKEPVPLTVSLRAADGHREIAVVPLDASTTAWADQQFRSCRW